MHEQQLVEEVAGGGAAIQLGQGQQVLIAQGQPVEVLTGHLLLQAGQVELDSYAAPSDLFDQLLLVQSRQEPLLLLTADAAMRSCGATVLGLEPAAPAQP